MGTVKSLYQRLHHHHVAVYYDQDLKILLKYFKRQ